MPDEPTERRYAYRRIASPVSQAEKDAMGAIERAYGSVSAPPAEAKKHTEQPHPD
jgi:hypothetical protein